MKTKKFYFFLILILLGSTSSCQKQDRHENKQTLRINFYSSLNSFHPQLSFDSRSTTISNALFEGLTRINLKGEIELALAEKIEISSCKRRYTFTLRSSKWSNGENVTSYDFINAWEKAISSQSVCAKFFFLIKNARKFYEGKLSFPEVGIEILSNNQFVVELEHPAPHFLKLISSSYYFPIYEMDLEEDPTVFNGPFLVEKFEMDKQLTLVPNSLYWDAKSVKLKKIKITFIKDMQTAFFMYERGELDWIGDPFSPIPIEALHTISNIKTKIGSSPFWIFCNSNYPKLQSINIRKALSYVINRKRVVTDILAYQKELNTIFPRTISNLPEKAFVDYYNVEEGKAFLDKGLKEIGISKKDFVLTLKYGTNPEYEKLALCLKNIWEGTLGIQVALQKEELNSFYSSIRSGNYEIAGFYVINMCNDSFYLMEFFEKSDTNHAKWEDKTYQGYLSLAKNSIDEEERLRYLRCAEEILMDHLPMIPICLKVCTYTHRENLKNFIPPCSTASDFKWAYFED